MKCSLMKNLFILSVVLFFGAPLQAQDFDTKKMRYIEQYKYWAMEEQVRAGVPAAISLAQGILETGSGTSELSTKANNHFGIKCKKDWTGETFLHDDDRRRECFRKYATAKESYQDHSNFLKEREHYAFLFKLEMTDYTSWSNGLRKAGYATNPKYASRLIQLIEKYNLQQHTYEAIELAEEQVAAKPSVAEVVPILDKETTELKVEAAPEKEEVVEVVQVAPKILSVPMKSKKKVVFDKLTSKNGRPGFWARKGDYLLPEAVQYNIRYAKLLSLNDLEDAPLSEDMFIYLKKKSKKGSRSFYKVKEGESLHSISQETGVQLKYLYIYNNLYDNEEPAVGEKIYLKARSERTPKLRGMTADQVEKRIEPNRVPVVKSKYLKSTKMDPTPKQIEELKRKKAAKEEIKSKRFPVGESAREKALSMEPTAKQREEMAEKKRLETEMKKRIISKNSKDVQVPTNVPSVRTSQASELKVTEIRPDKQAEVTNVKVIKGNSPIINLQKAKRVEAVMSDGKTEVEKLFIRNQEALKVQKVQSAPATNAKDLVIEKARKTQAKKKVKKRTYNQKGVSEDVKDLKKKFDNLIYEED